MPNPTILYDITDYNCIAWTARTYDTNRSDFLIFFEIITTLYGISFALSHPNIIIFMKPFFDSYILNLIRNALQNLTVQHVKNY